MPELLNLNWYIDIQERWQTSAGNLRIHNLSIPLTLNEMLAPQALFVGQDVTLQQFMDRVNEDLAAAALPVGWTSPEPSPGNVETWVTYKLSAIGRYAPDGRDANNFAIQYNLSKDPAVAYNAPGSCFSSATAFMVMASSTTTWARFPGPS